MGDRKYILTPNDHFSSEQAVLSIQDVFIKEESDNPLMNNPNQCDYPFTAAQEYEIGDNNELVLPPDTKEIVEAASQSLTTMERSEFVTGGQEMKPNSHFVKYVERDGKSIKLWECGICSKEFGHQYTLMRHLPTHTDERKFSCNTCGKAFRQMSTLSQHRAIHSSERPYVCEVCQKTFNRVSTLISHRKTHTGEKPHRCHLCNKSFHQKGNLRNHIFTHTNERPYKCDICSKGFNQMSNLMCHKMKAHHRSDKPKYSCNFCGQDFPKRNLLWSHEQFHHGTCSKMSKLPNPPKLQKRPSPVDTRTKKKITSGILVDPINTSAMRLALQSNQSPFALLKPLNGIPVLVRVLSAGDRQMLVPATAQDLHRHGHIHVKPSAQAATISSATVEGQDTSISSSSDQPQPSTSTFIPGTSQQNIEVCDSLNDPITMDTTENSTLACINAGKAGKDVLQIKIPVVATVMQRHSPDGSLCMLIRSPGPDSNLDDDDMGMARAYSANFTELDSGDISENSTISIPSTSSEQVCSNIQYYNQMGTLVPSNDYEILDDQTISFNTNFPPVQLQPLSPELSSTNFLTEMINQQQQPATAYIADCSNFTPTTSQYPQFNSTPNLQFTMPSGYGSNIHDFTENNSVIDFNESNTAMHDYNGSIGMTMGTNEDGDFSMYTNSSSLLFDDYTQFIN